MKYQNKVSKITGLTIRKEYTCLILTNQYMIDFSKLSQNELIEQAEKYGKLILKAKKDMDKSSNTRCIAGTDCSRSRMTTLNAKLQRDAEYFERVKSDLKIITNLL